MDQILLCPVCHVPLRTEYYFCYNCGKNLKPTPLSTSLEKQVLLYLGSVVLMPMGLVWGIRYLREKGTKPKMVAGVCIVLTVITFVVVSTILVQTIQNVNEEVNRQLNGLQGF